MIYSTRRKFLETSAAFVASLYATKLFDYKKDHLPLSFSTLGCPDWNFQKITDFAVQHGYTGIEVRGILREMDLPKCDEFKSAENRATTMQLMKQKGLRFVDLGSSANLHIADVTEREKNLEEARRFIDLAGQIQCPFVRVFPNSLPREQDREEALNRISKSLLELGEYAKGKKVSVLMETHGDLVNSADLEKVMHSASHPHTGLVWDVTNMWTITKEPPADVYAKLKKYIRHTHIKDAKMMGEKIEYTLMGQGEVPIFEAIDILRKGGYKGYYSFEWEKLWHPEIAGPEIALADYAEAMKKHFPG